MGVTKTLATIRKPSTATSQVKFFTFLNIFTQKKRIIIIDIDISVDDRNKLHTRNNDIIFIEQYL